MTFTDPARKGAAFIARRASHNPRELLISMIEGDPAAKRDKLFLRYTDALQDEDGVNIPKDGHLMAIVQYFFANMYEQFNSTKTRQRKKTPEQKAAETAKVEEIKTKITEIVILNLIMPNGKTMGECTGTEMIKFGGRFVGIGKKVGKKLVRAVLSEQQVRAALKS